MATNLVLRNTTTSGIIGSGVIYYDMLVDSFGSTTSTGVVDTAASGTEIQWTNSSAGDIELQWISGRTPAGGFTLTDVTAIQIWCHENSMNANCGARARFFHRSAAGTETEIGGGPFNDGVEFGTAATQMDWTANVTDTAFAENDRLLLKVYITNVGTMAAGFTCTLTFNGASGATGDSLITIAETVAFKANDVGTGEVLLLHANGTDGSTTFTDSSIRAHTVTAEANAQVDTAQFKFGGAAALFDGTADLLRLPSGTADFDFNLSDFTVDFWVRLNATGVQYNLFDFYPGGTDLAAPTIYIATNNTVRFFTLGSDRITGTTTLSANTWYHIALTRSGTSTRLFLDGVQEGSTFSDSNNYITSTPRPAIGSDPTAGLSLNGWMDEIRVLKDQAAWTANFTPPAAEYGTVSSFAFTPNSYLLPLIVR